MENSDDNKEPGYVSCSPSGEGDVIMEPDSGDKNGKGNEEENKESELSRSKEIQFCTILNFIIRVTYKRTDHIHLCLHQAHSHY